MANTMRYGDYYFTPIPILTINKEYQKTGDGTLVGMTVKMGLDGTLVAYPTGGLIAIDEAQDALEEALHDDGELFEIACDDNILLSTYPRINSLSFKPSSNHWVYTCEYSAEIEFDEFVAGSGAIGAFGSAFNNDFSSMSATYIKDAKEDWSVEFVEDNSKYVWNLDGGLLDTNPYQVKLTHNISAVGKRHYSSAGLVKHAWEHARDFVTTRLGYDSTQVTQSGVLNLLTTTSEGLYPYNHIRSVRVDELGGEYAVTENWLVVSVSGTGIAGKATENFTVTAKKGVDKDITTVTVEGTIVGLESRSYGSVPGDFAISQTKWAAASGYWTNVKPKLYGRARMIADGLSTRTLNTFKTSSVEGHNPSQGSINYTYEYDDRPYNCITNALTERITITDNYPKDVFAIIPILGRAIGPVLQSMNTITEQSRSINIEAFMPIPTGCGVSNLRTSGNPSSEVAAIIALFSGELSSSYAQVFKTEDTASWSPKDGHYTRNVTFVYQSCS